MRHAVAFEKAPVIRGSRSIRLNGMSSLTPYDKVLELKHQVISQKWFEFQHVRFPVDLGRDVTLPFTRLKRTKAGYDYVPSAHKGVVFPPDKYFEELLIKYRNDWACIGDVAAYNELPKHQLKNMLVASGYPTDCPNLFKHPNKMTKVELAEKVHYAHSTFHFCVWGDHGPVDGKSHVLFLHSMRFHNFQIKSFNVADRRQMYFEFQHLMKTIMICRMTSKSDITLGAMRAVADEYKALWQNGIDLEFQHQAIKFRGLFRWATGDLAFLASAAMVQKGGSSPNSYCLPASPIMRKDYSNFQM